MDYTNHMKNVPVLYVYRYMANSLHTSFPHPDSHSFSGKTQTFGAHLIDAPSYAFYLIANLYL